MHYNINRRNILNKLKDGRLVSGNDTLANVYWNLTINLWNLY